MPSLKSLKHWYLKLAFFYHIRFAQNPCLTDFIYCLWFQWKYPLPSEMHDTKLQSISYYLCNFHIHPSKEDYSKAV